MNDQPICGHTKPGLGIDDYWVCILPPHDTDPPPHIPRSAKHKQRKTWSKVPVPNWHDPKPGEHAYRARHLIE